MADGSIVQEHTAKGLDGLAPPGTIMPLAGRSWRRDESEEGEESSGSGVTPRLGAVLNYTPEIILFVSQPFDNSIKAINLTVGRLAGNQVFVPAASRVLRPPALDQPVDLAPALIEAENPNWASNTTMGESSDPVRLQPGQRHHRPHPRGWIRGGRAEGTGRASWPGFGSPQWHRRFP